jgi:hypothetical protein
MVKEEMIIASLSELANIANENDKEKSFKDQTSRLIFPQYRCGNHTNKKRISEQEARLLFIRELDKEKDVFYSIETPTTKSYKFSDKEDKKYEPKIVSVEEGGQSASFDLTIYNAQFKRVHFLEFKNGNVNTYKKDFLKLLCDEENKENYFVNIIERDDLEKGRTLKSIKDKYGEAVKYIAEHYEKEMLSTLKIILFNIKDRHLITFKDVKKQNTEIEELENKYVK